MSKKVTTPKACAMLEEARGSVSYSKIAEKAGVSKPHVYRLCTGVTNIMSAHPTVVKAVAEAIRPGLFSDVSAAAYSEWCEQAAA